MFKNTNSMVLKTSNSSYEELYNFLTYKTSSTSPKEIVMNSSSTNGKIYYSGYRTVNVPFAEKIGSPSEIDICVRGHIDTYGNSVTKFSTPEKYKKNVDAEETIHIFKDGTIRINLKYTVYSLEDTGSIMGSIKSRAYNSMLYTIESHIMSMYSTKRSLCFSKDPEYKIQTLDEFAKHFDVL
jgi:hypothetical protein